MDNLLRGGQRAAGSFLPYLATGGALGLGGSAAARAGMAGLGGIAGAGQSMIDTRQRIQEVQEHLQKFPGDEQARLQLQHLQDGANLHALLSGALSASTALLPTPGLSGATRGILPAVTRQVAAGTAQNDRPECLREESLCHRLPALLFGRQSRLRTPLLSGSCLPAG